MKYAAPPCEYCIGSHWLADNEALGPCVCCTPEALQALEDALDEAYVALGRRLRTAGDDDLTAAIEFARTTINEAWGMVNAALELRSDHDHGKDVTLADKIDEALDKAAETDGDAQEHLANYLVSVGLPVDPVTLDNPHLMALYEALNP